MGVVGAALALDITYILNMILTDLWVSWSKICPEAWIKIDKEAFKEWGSYLKIGIPGACMLCFEWWAFELLAIFSGYLGVIQLAAEVVVINMVSFIFMIPLGISYAASALTGNYIG